jgi:hypothetical protein
MIDLEDFNIKDIIVIDCEASGLKEHSYPIEVGLAFNDDSYSFLIKPEKDWTYWSKTAEKMHNIKREELFDEGISCYEAAQRLNSQLRGLTLFSDATDYEVFWINKLFKSAQCDCLFDIDSIYSFPFNGEVYAAEKKRMRSYIVAHRAENDAIIVRESLIKSLSRPL